MFKFIKKTKFYIKLRMFLIVLKTILFAIKDAYGIFDPDFELTAWKAYILNGHYGLSTPRFIWWRYASGNLPNLKVPEDVAYELKINIMHNSAMMPLTKIINKIDHDRIVCRIDNTESHFPNAMLFKSDDITEDEPDGILFRQIPVHVALVSQPFTHEIMETDGFNIFDQLIDNYSTTISEIIDKSVVYGDGMGKPAGLVHEIVEFQKSGNYFESGDIDSKTLFDIKKHLRINSIRNVHAYMNSDTAWRLRSIVDEHNYPVLELADEDDRPIRLMGYPVIINEFMDNFGDVHPDRPTVPIIIGNLKETYWLGRSDDYEIKRFDDSKYAEKDQSLYLLRFHIAGQPVRFDQMCLYAQTPAMPSSGDNPEKWTDGIDEAAYEALDELANRVNQIEDNDDLAVAV